MNFFGLDFGDFSFIEFFNNFKNVVTNVLIVMTYLGVAYLGVLYILANRIRFSFKIPRKTQRLYTCDRETINEALGGAENCRIHAEGNDGRHENFLLHYIGRNNHEGYVTGRFYPAPTPSKGIYIYVHSIGHNLLKGLEYLEFAHKNSYDLLVFDQPNHGKSYNNGKGNSFGFHESKALEAILNYIHQRFPEKGLVIHGAGMGAASAIICLAESEQNHKNWHYRIEKVILENPIYSIKKIIFSLFLDKKTKVFSSNRVLDMHAFLTKSNPCYTPMSLIGQINNKIHIFHSTQDELAPFFLSLQAQKQNPNIKLHIMDKGKHNLLFKENPTLFEEALRA